jgi:hypothetical protein
MRKIAVIKLGTQKKNAWRSLPVMNVSMKYEISSRNQKFRVDRIPECRYWLQILLIARSHADFVPRKNERLTFGYLKWT